MMASKNAAIYDVFLSYQWDVKESVTRLYTQLIETHGLRCWMDDFEMGCGDLNESKFLFFVCEACVFDVRFEI